MKHQLADDDIYLPGFKRADIKAMMPGYSDRTLAFDFCMYMLKVYWARAQEVGAVRHDDDLWSFASRMTGIVDGWRLFAGPDFDRVQAKIVERIRRTGGA